MKLIDTPLSNLYPLFAGVLAWSLYTVQQDNHKEVFTDLIIPALTKCAYKVAVREDDRCFEALVRYPRGSLTRELCRRSLVWSTTPALLLSTTTTDCPGCLC